MLDFSHSANVVPLSSVEYSSGYWYAGTVIIILFIQRSPNKSDACLLTLLDFHLFLSALYLSRNIHTIVSHSQLFYFRYYDLLALHGNFWEMESAVEFLTFARKRRIKRANLLRKFHSAYT